MPHCPWGGPGAQDKAPGTAPPALLCLSLLLFWHFLSHFLAHANAVCVPMGALCTARRQKFLYKIPAGLSLSCSPRFSLRW